MRIEYRSSKMKQISDSVIAVEDMESCGQKKNAVFNDREKITCNTQLYPKSGCDEKAMRCNSPMDIVFNRERDGRSQTNVSLQEGSYLASSSSTCCTQDNWDSGLLLLSGKRNAIIDLGILQSDYEN